MATAAWPATVCFGQQCVLACLQHAACLPIPDPYAELLIKLWSQREREAEGESDRDPEGGEITPRRSRCTRKRRQAAEEEGRERDRRGERDD